jgi:hypothetical protein
MTRERQRERKERKDPGHSTPRGPSVIDHLETALLRQMSRYVDQPSDTVRGVIRGLAMGIARMRFPYENQNVAIRRIEKDFSRRAKGIER